MGSKPYKTLGKKGESLYEDRRSEFLGCAVPVSSEEEAAEFVRSVKKQHPAARAQRVGIWFCATAQKGIPTTVSRRAARGCLCLRSCASPVSAMPR